jgi:uncharacterized membrane protein
MTAVAIALCLLCQLFLVVGQLLLKRAMNATPLRAGSLAAGIALLAAWFFLWLGLLANWELSHLFPFEGLNPALLVFGAWLFLKERVPLTGWIGIALISVGVALVSAS